jgi:ATP/maltotriose-dependent transcriptional regulator MalT
MLEESVALFRELGDRAGLAMALSELAEGIYRRDDTEATGALFEECVVLAREAKDQWVLAMALRTLGGFIYSYNPGAVERATLLLEESLALSRALGDTWGLVRVLMMLTRVALDQGNVKQAAVLTQENLTLARELGNKPEIVEGLYHLATTKMLQGDESQAAALFEESIVHARELGDMDNSKDHIARALLALGRIALRQHHLEQAATVLQQSLALFRATGFKDTIALALAASGEVSRVQGNLPRAAALCAEGLTLAREIEYSLGIGSNLVGLARVAADEGRLQQSARLFAAAAPWIKPGVELDPFDRAGNERAVQRVREQLGDKVFAAVWAEGRTMPLDGVLATSGPASSAPSPVSPEQARPTYPADLTPREVEVLRLVAQGLTNAQIAAQLVLSLHTVNNHVRSILSKLGVASRSGATRFAFEHRLL